MTQRSKAGIAIIAGNGLSIDRAKSAGLEVDLSSPFAWPIPNPGTRTPVIDALPALKSWLETVVEEYPERTDFEHIVELLSGSKTASYPGELLEVGSGFEVHCELRHYLAHSYAWFQLQLDRRQKQESWTWYRWIERNRLNIRVALSLNYDLVLERALLRSKKPYHYAGTGIRVQQGIPVCKPHGSCNFASTLEMVPLDAGGNPLPITYPLATYSWRVDGADVRIIPDQHLSHPRATVDIVAPGEWSMLKGVNWVEAAHMEFVRQARACEVLVFIGISYGVCDRAELDNVIERTLPYARAIIADPTPNTDLIGMLRDHGIEAEIWQDGPKVL